MKRISSVILRVLPLLLIISIFLAPPQVRAQQYEWTGVCVGEALGEKGADVATIQGLQCLIANIFSIIITVIGLAGFVMFVWGAFQWMLSGNNTKGVETARQSMTYAIIGIVVALSGFIIINLIAEFTGVNIIREFKIPSSETPSDGTDPVVADQNTV